MVRFTSTANLAEADTFGGPTSSLVATHGIEYHIVQAQSVEAIVKDKEARFASVALVPAILFPDSNSKFSRTVMAVDVTQIDDANRLDYST